MAQASRGALRLAWLRTAAGGAAGLEQEKGLCAPPPSQVPFGAAEETQGT